ncbi:MAG TPA: ABC transporter substrate-binding protein [Anaerolineales bacterium]|nr:ABC transporter substrate-binding protein [Anaerolineales bacterium]
MYQLNLDGTYSLELAESVDVSDDGTVWTFAIRDGMTFHDGTPLTAEDVAFSYNFYQANEDFPFLNVYTAYFDSVEATDEQTVVITLSEAIPNMESQLIFLYVLPQHVWEAEDPVEFENVEMIGSGPFRMLEYSQNEFVRLAATGEHPLYSPNISEVVFQTFENQDALVQAIRTGQVDMITEMPNTAVASLRDAENVEVVSGAPFYPSVSDIIFNLVEPENCPPDDGVCSGHPALRDRQVRLALAHATDKQQIIDVVLLGLGDPGLTLIPNGLGPFYNDSLEDYAYDINLANQILDDAGYLDSDGDGIREMPDGTNPLNFRMNYPSDSTNAPRESELLKEMWAQIGVGVEIQALDPDALTSVCCPAFDFDIILWGWGSDPDPGFLLSVMLTEEIPTGNSETGYSNPTYDELYAQQATELDFEARREIIWEMQRIVHEDVVYIIPFYDQTVQAYRTDRFTGWPTDAGKLALEDITSLVVIEPVR